MLLADNGEHFVCVILSQMAAMSGIKIGEDEYEPIPEQQYAASQMLAGIWAGMGRPETPLSVAGERVMAAIISVWEELYPEQVGPWLQDRQDYQLNEMTTKEQVRKHTGRSLASFPFPIYAMMQKIFPNFKATHRENCMKLVAKFPMFRMANKV